MGFFAMLVIGAIAGWIAGIMMRGSGYSWPVNIGLGIVGSIVGGWIGSLLLGVDLITGINLTTLITAIIGSVIVIAIYRLITRRSVTR